MSFCQDSFLCLFRNILHYRIVCSEVSEYRLSATIEKLNSDYTGEALEASATYTVQGSVMQIMIPRAALGLEDGGDFYFKVADGVSDPAEIMDYYATGRSLPMGRLSYLYQMDK